MSFALLWLRGFGLTWMVESAVAIPLLVSTESSRIRRLMAVLLANLATHPLVWFFLSSLGWSRTTFACVAEAWAFGFEILVYRVIFDQAPWRRCLIVSVGANAASFLVGVVATKWGLYRA